MNLIIKINLIKNQKECQQQAQDFILLKTQLHMDLNQFQVKKYKNKYYNFLLLNIFLNKI